MEQPLRILYVDDSPFDRDLVRDALGQEPGAFLLCVATNRTEFEALLPQGPWDLVLSDFNILGFEGLQVLEAVKGMDANLPVVIVTGTGSEEIAVEAMKRGASDYTIKTNQHLQRLPTTIRQALKHHRIAAERDRLFNLSADLLAVVGADGLLAQVNPAWNACLGWSPGELIGRSPLELVHPDDREDLIRGREALSRGEPLRNFENRFRCQDGSYRWLSWNSQPLVDSGLVFAVARDVTERVLSQEALRQSELEQRQLAERLTTAQAVASVGSWETDLATLEVTWTAETHRIFGTDPDTFQPTHTTFLERVHPLDREAVDLAFATSPGAEGPFEIEHRILLPDGRIKFVNERWRVFQDQDGRPTRAVGTSQDISERKRQEQTQTALHLISEAAHAAETLPELFRGLHEIISTLLPARNFFVALHDEATDELSFPYFVDERDASPGARKLDDETLSGQVIRQGRSLLLTRDAQGGSSRDGLPVVGTDALEWLGVPLKSGARVIGALVVQSYSGEVRFNPRDQALLEFVSGQAAAAIDRKRAEQELRDQNDLFRLVQRATNDLVYVRDIATGALAWSDTLQAMFGYTPEEVVPTLAWRREHMHPEDRDRVVKGLEEVLTQGGSSWSDKYRFLRKDGSYAQVLDRGYVVRDPAGRATRVVGAMSDLTMLMKAEEALAANQAKSDFLATMTHEIRTPMIGMLGMVEILSHSPLDGDQKRALGVIQSSAQSLLGIIGDILDFSKIEAGRLVLEPQVVSLRNIVEDAFSTFAAAAAGKGLELTCELDSRIAAAHRVDPVRFREIISNFLSNSLKFTLMGGVSLHAVVLEDIGARQTLAFRVKDTGIGVSAENQKRLFQPFVQAESNTTRRFGGSGLGLSICLRLAQMMGGSITMESAEGVGTTMSFVAPFPVESPPPADAPASTAWEPVEPPSREAALAAGRLLLLVEDHPTNRLVLKRQLHLAGYQTDTAEDGLQALEAMQHCRYGLVLTDIHMPRMDGYELALEIRNREARGGQARLPVLALTANAVKGELDRCLAAGMDDCIIKPVGIPELAEKLRQWLP